MLQWRPEESVAHLGPVVDENDEGVVAWARGFKGAPFLQSGKKMAQRRRRRARLPPVRFLASTTLLSSSHFPSLSSKAQLTLAYLLVVFFFSISLSISLLLLPLSLLFFFSFLLFLPLWTVARAEALRGCWFGAELRGLRAGVALYSQMSKGG